MIIVGAGLSGLLAGNMLRHHNPIIVEAQSSLPNNHSAVLRFRTSAIGDVCNIPFRKVTMIKAHVPWRNAVADVLAYSYKNTGVYRSDRSIVVGLVTDDRWVAPSDLIPRMATTLQIEYNQEYKFDGIRNDPTISTIPMPVLMNALGYKHELKFTHTSGVNISATIADCDAYVSLLFPDPNIPFSRLSITGNELILEAYQIQGKYDNQTYAQLCVSRAADFLGIKDKNFSDIQVHHQKYAKINPIDDTARKNFLWWATDKYNIFALGRFATWRPGLMQDDLVNDLRKIDGWIKQGHYSIARHR